MSGPWRAVLATALLASLVAGCLEGGDRETAGDGPAPLIPAFGRFDAGQAFWAGEPCAPYGAADVPAPTGTAATSTGRGLSLQLGATQAPTQATIKTDEYGVSHIYADDAYTLFYANGYVQARDRLFQLDVLRHVGYGDSAMVAGS